MSRRIGNPEISSTKTTVILPIEVAIGVTEDHTENPEAADGLVAIATVDTTLAVGPYEFRGRDEIRGDTVNDSFPDDDDAGLFTHVLEISTDAVVGDYVIERVGLINNIRQSLAEARKQSARLGAIAGASSIGTAWLAIETNGNMKYTAFATGVLAGAAIFWKFLEEDEDSSGSIKSKADVITRRLPNYERTVEHKAVLGVLARADVIPLKEAPNPDSETTTETDDAATVDDYPEARRDPTTTTKTTYEHVVDGPDFNRVGNPKPDDFHIG